MKGSPTPPWVLGTAPGCNLRTSLDVCVVCAACGPIEMLPTYPGSGALQFGATDSLELFPQHVNLPNNMFDLFFIQ